MLGNQSSAYNLAIGYIKEGKPITAIEVNKVLSFSNIKIDQETLNKVLAQPRLEFTDLNIDTVKTDKFVKTIGTIRSNVQIPGVYIWTHLPTNDMYVGSSSKLARRLTGYFRNDHKSTGKLIPLIKKEGLSNFKLQVLPLIESYTVNQELSIEQYFLLQTKFNLNTLRVVKDYSGARALPLYMYTKDLSELIYYSNVQEDYTLKLGIHYTTFKNCLKTGKAYLDKYIFTAKPILDSKNSCMKEEKLNSILIKDRLEVYKYKGKKVVISEIAGNNTIVFDSIKSCVAYLETIAPSNKSTLSRHIEAGTPYNGYLCKWENADVKMSIASKAKCVNVTHVPSGEFTTHSSLRKAAIYLNTTGPTLKAYSDKSELFKGVFRIDITI